MPARRSHEEAWTSLENMLWRDLKAWQIFGANTDVGKSVVSTVLCKALARRVPANQILYLKPVSTGPSDDSDTLKLHRNVDGIVARGLLEYPVPRSPHLEARELVSLVAF